MLIRALEENSALYCRVLHMECPLFCHFLWSFLKCVCQITESVNVKML